MELGDQVYRLRLVRESQIRDTIELVIIPSPDLTPDEQEQAHQLKMKFIDTLKQFIDGLMQQHMEVVAEDYPVKIFVPCEQCHSLHIELEKIATAKKVYCKQSNQYVKIAADWQAFWFPGMYAASLVLVIRIMFLYRAV